MKKKEKNIQSPAAQAERKPRRWLWIALAIVLVIAAVVAGWYMMRYQFNNTYRQYIVEPEAAAEGMDFAALQDDAPAIPGLAMVASNDSVKVYADASTGETAIYDMRTKTTSYYLSEKDAKTGLAVKVDDEMPEAEGMALVAQNSTLKLYANGDTGVVAIHDLRTGETIYSNPPLADKDKVANKTNRGYLKSQLKVDYFNANLTEGSYSSFADCVDYGELEVQTIRNGVRFIYTLGEKKTVYYVPHMLTDERYQELYTQVDSSVQRLMYGQANSFYGPSEDGYWRVTENGLKIPLKSLKKMSDAFVELGMTEGEYNDWQDLAGVVTPETLGFTVALDWTLKGDSVECTVPPELIQERGGGMIKAIHLLQYMGAAGQDEEGYMVVPNGSGSLIYFNNGKQSNAQYSQYVYDMDLVDAEYTKTQNMQSVRMPLFAICREKSTLLATIEEGETFANITADVSGRNNAYNNVYALFTLRGDEKLAMFGAGETADMPIGEDKYYAETLTVRYTLLTEENKGYSGVANYYRQRLINEGVLTLKAEGGDIPFYYDVIGGVKETAHTMGVQHLTVKAMTTFEQADDMAQQLGKLGVSNQVMNFQGWMNGGYYHDVVSKVKILRQLGGKAGLEALDAAMTRLGGELYADVAFQNVTFISKRYMVNEETSRYYGAGYAVQFGEVNPANLRRTTGLGYAENLYNLLSPKFLPYYVDKFINATEDMQLTGVSLRDLGYELHADKKRTNVINREEALMIVESQLKALRDTGRKLMITGGNDYALNGVSHVLGAPMSATQYFIVDQEIPLYQMILHGCVDYTGKALNTVVSDDWQSDLLKLIEYGASTRYIFTWQDATEMKYTGLNKYYATTFSAWADEAAQKYQYVNGALAQVSNAAMVEHVSVTDTLKRVTYSNGVTIYINYGSESAQADGYTIPAKEYLAMGGVK